MKIVRRRALVVSPFATAPRDAGHRRRTWQMTRLLADAGYHVTFLLFAFEDGWAWSHDAEVAAELRAAWDDVIIVHAGEHVGRPPTDGPTHRLDEWWDAGLEAVLANLSTRRFFDVVVVHNVWLSKAFDFVHPGSTKVLETHDLFFRRADAFAAIGLPPAFFTIDREGELFGLARADILVTIQEQEARSLLALSPRRVVNVPFYDPSLEGEDEPARLRDAGKVSFGFLGSANPFNTHGLNALLRAVEAEVAERFAPAEIVVGGSVCDTLRTRLPVRRLGRVPSERGFYAEVDYAIAPVFAGTGFKIKTADAVALSRPLLCARHAAEGVPIDSALVFDTPESMAAAIASISLRRPDPRPAQARVRQARERLREGARRGRESLLRAIARARTTLVVDLHDACIERDAFKLQSWFGVLRVLAARAPVLVLLPDEITRLVETLLPPGARALDFAAFSVAIDMWPSRIVVDATTLGARRGGDLCDARWPIGAVSAGVVGMPFLHPNVLWEPAALRLRAAWAATGLAAATLLPPGSLLLRGGLRESHYRIRTDRGITVVDPADGAAVEAAFMRLLCGAPGCQVLLGAAVRPAVRQAALELCAIAGVSLRGRIDDAALAPARLPVSAPAEITRAARMAAETLTGLREVRCQDA